MPQKLTCVNLCLTPSSYKFTLKAILKSYTCMIIFLPMIHLLKTLDFYLRTSYLWIYIAETIVSVR